MALDGPEQRDAGEREQHPPADEHPHEERGADDRRGHGDRAEIPAHPRHGALGVGPRRIDRDTAPPVAARRPTGSSAPCTCCSRGRREPQAEADHAPPAAPATDATAARHAPDPSRDRRHDDARAPPRPRSRRPSPRRAASRRSAGRGGTRSCAATTSVKPEHDARNQPDAARGAAERDRSSIARVGDEPHDRRTAARDPVSAASASMRAACNMPRTRPATSATRGRRNARSIGEDPQPGEDQHLHRDLGVGVARERHLREAGTRSSRARRARRTGCARAATPRRRTRAARPPRAAASPRT